MVNNMEVGDYEIIYILINEAMPDYVKIGRTNEDGLKDRVRTLSNTSVPFPFELFYACKVPTDRNAETLLHGAFDKYRVSARREFFEISPEEARFALDLTGGEEVFLDAVKVIDDPIQQRAFEKAKERKDRFNFHMVDIPSGAKLQFARNPEMEVTVVDERRVKMDGGEVLSTSKAAEKLLKEMGIIWKSVQGPAFFMYDGETLKDRRSRMEFGD